MRNKIISLLLLTFAFLITSCQQDYQISTDEIMFGKRDTVSVSIKLNLLSTTKATVNEALVDNVNLYIVNELGDVISSGYYTSLNDLDIEIYSNMLYSVYAIANTGKEIMAKSATEIEGLSYTIDTANDMVSPSGAILMSGKTALQKLSDGQQLPVDLTRCLSKVIFQCDFTQLNADVTINVKSIQLKNIPKSVNIFTDSKAVSSTDVISSVPVVSPSPDATQSGIVFYCYENLQGTLLPDNLDQSCKVFDSGSLHSQTCSYIEIAADYSSPRKKGEITYKFYCGKDVTSNFDLPRNHQQTITVYFTGDGAVEENTWRVDNSDIIDLVTSISITPQSLTFKALGETLQLSSTVLPLTADNKQLAWSSSDTDIAIVDSDGKVTAISDGECTVTATSCDGTNISATCTIVVDSKVLVSGIEVEPTALSLYPDDEKILTATVQPDNATVKTFVWSSSDTDIAIVDSDGKVTAIAPGNCSIYAISTDDPSKKGECKVTVNSKEFSIDPTEHTLYVGESFEINYTVKPPVAPVFSSSDTSVATVDENGKVTALAAGVAKISATAHGITLQCAVTVVAPQVEFPADGRVMYDGEVATIPYSVLVPSYADVEISLSSQNAELISNDASGITVKAITPGICTITAKVGPASDTYTLDIQKLTITPVSSDLTLYNEFYDDIAYTITPSHASGLKVNVTSSASEDDMQTNFNSISNRVFPQYDTLRTSLPVSATLTLSIDGRPDVSAAVNAVIKPSFTMRTSLELNANMGNTASTGNLQIDTHPRAILGEFWLHYGKKETPADITLRKDTGIVELSVPTAANGDYQLILSINTDKELKLNTYTYISRTCNITIYETVWLVGVNRISERESLINNITENVFIYKYYNEIKGAWLTHPMSKNFPGGKANYYTGEFYYKGTIYKEGVVCGVAQYQFSFTKGNYYDYAFGKGHFVFNGSNAPDHYIDFYELEPAGELTPKITGANNEVYLCKIITVRFGGGFATKDIEWEDIFDILYPKKQ